jgi:Rrf2 family protein
MKLSTRSRYGTRILLELARSRDEVPVQVSAISSRQGIPLKYVEQILRLLKIAGLIKSVRGAKGGHLLAKEPDRISLGDIVRLFEGQTDLVGCISSPEQCEMADNCKVRIAWKEATEVLYTKLDAIRISDLVDNEHPVLRGGVRS